MDLLPPPLSGRNGEQPDAGGNGLISFRLVLDFLGQLLNLFSLLDDLQRQNVLVGLIDLFLKGLGKLRKLAGVFLHLLEVVFEQCIFLLLGPSWRIGGWGFRKRIRIGKLFRRYCREPTVLSGQRAGHEED